MTTPKVDILELAKQGNPGAISKLLNRQLSPKGITAKTQIKNDQLQILLEAEEAPDKSLYAQSIETGLKKIKPLDLRSVKVFGKSVKEDFPEWNYSFNLSEEDNIFKFEEPKLSSQRSNGQEYFEAEGKNGKIKLTNKRVKISREGFWGFVSQGSAGTKEIPLKNITAVQFKPAKYPITGFIQFSIQGGKESQGGVFMAASDENTVIFNPEQQPNFEEVKRYIDSVIDDEPIQLSSLSYTNPETVKVEMPFWNKHLGELVNGETVNNESDKLPTETPKSSKANRVVVAYSGIFLGLFGIHKFILGYHLEGFILLGVTFFSLGTLGFISWLIGFVEGILYLLKSDRQFQHTYVQNKRRWF
jgi:TM2 domain-containing membrane protein YozV